MTPSQGKRREKAGHGRKPQTERSVPVDRPGLAARMTAARLLAAIVDTSTSLDALTDQEHGHPQFLALEPRDRALVRAILVTALRFRGTISDLIEARLQRPLPANARTLLHVLHVAAAQMLFLNIPDSAAVDLAVTHAQGDPRTSRFANLVNAVLRELGRRKERALPAALSRGQDAPDWFVERLKAGYGDTQTAAILAAHRREPPMDFTVKSDPEGWAAKFGGTVLPNGSVRAERLPSSVPELAGYGDGEWWVQDVAASLPARLLGDVSGQRVLDLCAAPGGKTAQLAQAGAKVTAVDLSRSRLKRLKANLLRLKLEANIVEADASTFAMGELFDAILLDAPCSSTGTVRRHPDVPWTKSTDDIAKLAALQRRILDHTITLLRPGGRLVFANCSLDPIEGEELIAGFLADHPDVTLDAIKPAEVPGFEQEVTGAGWLRTTPASLVFDQPEMSGCDGFFAARFTR